jgi:CBS domain-containing protein
MHKEFSLAGGVGIGAGMMYFFDPDKGRRRRALVRDKAISWSRRTRRGTKAAARDMRYRAQGLMASVTSWVRRDRAPSDRVLTERIRAALGLATQHPGSIDVQARHGVVILQGPVLEEEVEKILSAVQRVEGVERIENYLETHAEPGRLPDLQGSRQGRSRGAHGQRLAFNWSPTARVMTAAGTAGVIYGLMRLFQSSAGMSGAMRPARKRLSEIMTRDVEVIGPEDHLLRAAEMMKQWNVGALPVCDGDRLVGMLTDRDIVVRVVANRRDPRLVSVRDAMTTGVAYCFEDDDVRRASELMAEQQIRRLPVVNREQRLVGIVSLGDVAVDQPNDRMTGETLEQISYPAEPRR